MPQHVEKEASVFVCAGGDRLDEWPHLMGLPSGPPYFAFSVDHHPQGPGNVCMTKSGRAEKAHLFANHVRKRGGKWFRCWLLWSCCLRIPRLAAYLSAIDNSQEHTCVSYDERHLGIGFCTWKNMYKRRRSWVLIATMDPVDSPCATRRWIHLQTKSSPCFESLKGCSSPRPSRQQLWSVIRRVPYSLAPPPLRSPGHSKMR